MRPCLEQGGGKEEEEEKNGGEGRGEEPGMVVLGGDSVVNSTQEVEAERSGVQVHPPLHCEFESRLVHKRSCLKTKEI